MGLFSDGPKGTSPELRQAIEDARRRLEESPTDAAAVLKLADALVASGRKTEAVRVLNRFGPIVQSKGRLEAAIAIFKKATQLDPDSELTSSTYLSHLQLQQILDAEKAVRAATSRPASPPPSGSFTRPGPDPLPPSGSAFELAAAPPLAEPPAGPPPSAPLPRTAAAVPASDDSDAASAPAPSGPSAWSQKKEAVHDAQAGIPLLRDIPPFLLDLVLQRINLITLAPGDVLIREGAEGSSVYFVVQGTLAVTARHDLGTEVLLRTARDGEVIGEAAFLTGLPSYATVTAREPSNLLELDRNALVPIARKNRTLADALNRLYEERVLHSALVRSRVFGVLSEPELRLLARKLETTAVPAGTLVAQEGVPAKGAWIVKRGAFRVTFRADGHEVAVALLRPHEVFGDLAEGRDLPQAESVTAIAESELLFLPAEDLSTFRTRSVRLSEALDALRLERAKMCVAALRASRR
ncbi:MAG TPA: cyclic nucleotide-binding domain-containing protein [Thermoanaerobaculia bacterium]|jgi:CRP-like cAMP-binding protein|nr:cyclic nucleotide-binding domain-containing protein [Thermoanaerobaculia bacterium]HQN07929.1 cyclic nucleotide-binding domain-containing protein [Thermoanaerobaculia bacterium]HQP88453.1 cyclic nucleotide-binding domain-containing protein [Thermoanaerobaculia bacterium]